MDKDTLYFSHDYNCRNDEKIKRLIRKHGMIGYGIYWAIVEDLYNNANALQTDYDGIAYDLRVDTDIVKKILNDFELFVVNKTTFSSNSVARRISRRNEKSIKARESADKRWSMMRTHSESDTDALQSESESNAIKKGNKEKKEIKKGGMGENMKGSKFDTSKTFVIFQDGSKQKLGTNQLHAISENKLQAKDVTKGIIY